MEFTIIKKICSPPTSVKITDLMSSDVCRGTAFGILNGICKFAAIIASSIFAAFIGITKIIPIFLAFSALVCGGLVALKLPETREKILS